MNISKAVFKQIILITILAIAVPLAANAESSMEEGLGQMGSQPFSDNMHHSQHCNDNSRTSIFSMRLDLSESQQDKIFFIMYAQAQELHEQDKIVRNAYINLHKLYTSEQYSDDKAEAISESLAKARAAIALIHAQEENRIYALLTKEQRKLLSIQQTGQSDEKPKCSFKPGNRVGNDCSCVAVRQCGHDCTWVIGFCAGKCRNASWTCDVGPFATTRQKPRKLCL